MRPLPKDVVFHTSCTSAIKWIYKLQEWRPEAIEQRIPGIKASVWRCYGQQSYTKRRVFHVMAALCWLTQIPLETLCKEGYREWRGEDRCIRDTVVRTAILTPQQFEQFALILMEQLDEETLQYASKMNVEGYLYRVKTYESNAFLMPSPLDLDEFRDDIHRSIALNLMEFRHSQEMSVSMMANKLGMGIIEYRSIEVLLEPRIPLSLQEKLRQAFPTETIPKLGSKMRVYSGWNTAYRVQRIREYIITHLLCKTTPEFQENARKLALDIVRFQAHALKYNKIYF